MTLFPMLSATLAVLGTTFTGKATGLPTSGSMERSDSATSPTNLITRAGQARVCFTHTAGPGYFLGDSNAVGDQIASFCDQQEGRTLGQTMTLDSGHTPLSSSPNVTIALLISNVRCADGEHIVGCNANFHQIADYCWTADSPLSNYGGVWDDDQGCGTYSILVGTD